MRVRGPTLTRAFGDTRKALRPRALALLALAFPVIASISADTTRAEKIVIQSRPELSIWGGISPSKLPRLKPAPVTVKVGFMVEAETCVSPELESIALEIFRNVIFQKTGLPSCPLAKLYSTTTPARQACAGSLVGHGRVISEVTLPGREPATIDGSLLAFYNSAEGKPGILAQVTSGGVLPLAYVIPFRFENAGGDFGTRLFVSKSRMRAIAGSCVPQSACFGPTYGFQGIYGHISSFELSLHRLFLNHGKRESFVSADCPAQARQLSAGFESVSVRYAESSYSGGASATLLGTCKVSG
jgi:hypothetical protein